MRKIFILLLVLGPITAFAQLRGDYIQLNDSATVGDTKMLPTGIEFPDGTTQSTAAATVDSVAFSDTASYAEKSDTSTFATSAMSSDSSNYATASNTAINSDTSSYAQRSDTSNYAYESRKADTAEYAINGGIEEAPIDGNTYGRNNSSWTEIEATADSIFYVLKGKDSVITPVLRLYNAIDEDSLSKIDKGVALWADEVTEIVSVKNFDNRLDLTESGLYLRSNFTSGYVGGGVNQYFSIKPNTNNETWRFYDHGLYVYNGNTVVDTVAMLSDITSSGSSSDSSLVSSTNQVDLILDTLNALLVNGQFKTLSVTDSIFINNMWVNGVDTSTTRVIDVDKVTTDTLSLAGVELDSVIELKYAVENESFGDVNIDTISPSSDSLLVQGKIISDYYIGQLYTDDGSVTVSTSVINTYYDISGLETANTWNIAENLTLTSSTITIPSDGYGYYNVYAGYSYTHSNSNTICHVSVFVQRGGSGSFIEITANEAQRKIGIGGDVGDAGRECSVLLGNNDVLKTMIKADDTGTVTIEHGTFKAVRIN